jgi:hypothetical protein
MKITVRISSIEIIIDRPDMSDYDSRAVLDGREWRNALMSDSVVPMLTEAVKQAKELYLTGRDAKPNEN